MALNLVLFYQTILFQILKLSRRFVIYGFKVLHNFKGNNNSNIQSCQYLQLVMPYLRIRIIQDYQQIKMHQQVKLNPSALTQSQQNMEIVMGLLRNFGGYNEEEINQFKEAINDVKLNRVLGCIFGGMIGDALGSYCQFKKTIPNAVLQEAMKMPGGGTFYDILPGQYTDDNELAYHLLMGLNHFKENQSFEQNSFRVIKKIGLQYVRWTANSPFDIGNTCSAAISILRKNQQFLKQEEENEKSTLQMENILQEIFIENQTRQSNGSLMRITPMAAFFSLFDLDIDIQNHSTFIEYEIKLTHPNKQLVIAGTCWVSLLSQLINRQSDNFKQILQRVHGFKYSHRIQEWFTEAQKLQEKSMTAAHNMGWAKIAWSYGLKFLVQLIKGRSLVNGTGLYKQWIKWVIGRAGDTDTNAAISGGLIGAVIGFRQLPIEYLEKVFSLEYINVKLSTYRPKEYEPSNFLKETLKMIRKSKDHKQWLKSKAQEL